DGIARRGDVRSAQDRLAGACSEKLRMVVTHHPLIAVEGYLRARPVRRARGALEAFESQHVEILMSGHIHQTFAVELRSAYDGMIAIGAPTSLSTRIRGEPNGFWMIKVQPKELALTLHSFDGASFAQRQDTIRFVREKPGAALARLGVTG